MVYQIRPVVNLGRLYSSSRNLRETSWAYFEDGSVYVVPHTHLDHDALELRMKLTAPFVSAPTPRMQAERQSEARKKRSVVINNDQTTSPGPILRLISRNVHDGEHITAADVPFEHVAVPFNETTHELMPMELKGSSELTSRQKFAVKKAFCTFRGTLVDNTLQPNVWLGNGIQLFDMPILLRQLLTERLKAAGETLGDFSRTRLSRRQSSEEKPTVPDSSKPKGSQQGPLKKKKKPTSQDYSKPRGSQQQFLAKPVTRAVLREVELREALLEAKARELKAREQGLHWKYKALASQQTLKKQRLYTRPRPYRRAKRRPLWQTFSRPLERDIKNELADLTPRNPTARSMTMGDSFGSDSPDYTTASYSPDTAPQLESTVAYSPAPFTRQASAQFDTGSTDDFISSNEPPSITSSSNWTRAPSDSLPFSDLDTTPRAYSPTPTARQASTQSLAENTDTSGPSDEPKTPFPSRGPARPPSDDLFAELTFDSSPPDELAKLRSRGRRNT